ncbi:MAG: hypothetical protein KTR24_04160, partial [Saprospiraceae bacterium]|nr:hypothetical protein [Saprospiraceae bacterium]
MCIVKVTSEDGLVGWGEGYGPAAVVKAGVDLLTPYVVGQHVLETETIWSIMYRRTLDFARRGVLVASISAIDIALWDLKGKTLGEPVHRLLGGAKREAIVPYATGMYFSQVENLSQRLAEEASAYRDMGFK